MTFVIVIHLYVCVEENIAKFSTMIMKQDNLNLKIQNIFL